MSPYVETVSCGGVFSRKNTPEELTGTHKSSFFSQKQVSGRNGDHDDLECPMLSYYVIYCEKFRLVANREGSFNKWQTIVKPTDIKIIL